MNEGWFGKERGWYKCFTWTHHTDYIYIFQISVLQIFVHCYWHATAEKGKTFITIYIKCRIDGTVF